jgi:hypothetical protein
MSERQPGERDHRRLVAELRRALDGGRRRSDAIVGSLSDRAVVVAYPADGCRSGTSGRQSVRSTSTSDGGVTSAAGTPVGLGRRAA